MAAPATIWCALGLEARHLASLGERQCRQPVELGLNRAFAQSVPMYRLRVVLDETEVERG